MNKEYLEIPGYPNVSTIPNKISSKEIQQFLEQVWTAVSDPRNRFVVKWTNGGRVFKVIDEKVFYSELCQKFCAGCDKRYFNYFMWKCGFQSIPPLEIEFYHPDFLEHEFGRIKSIQPKETIFTPLVYHSCYLETPVPEVFEPSPHRRRGTVIKRKSRGSEAASVEDAASEIKTVESLGSHNSLKETFTLDLGYNSPSVDHSPKSTSSTLVSTPSLDSAISCSTSEPLFLRDPSTVIPTKKGIEKELTRNLNDCRLQEQASDSSSSTLTSGSNSPNTASPTADLKAFTKTPDIPPPADDVKDLISNFKLDLVSSVSNEEYADLHSVSNPRISTPYDVLDAKKTVKTSFVLDL